MSSERSIVRLKFRQVGTQSPVFVAGTFSHPPWTPIKMDCPTDDSSGSGGEYTFALDLDVDKGVDHQYKFRIGEGDWWVLDEESPIVTDDAGNRNNLLSHEQLERASDRAVGEGNNIAVYVEEKREKTEERENESDHANPNLNLNLDLETTHNHQLELAQITPGMEPLDSISSATSALTRSEFEENGEDVSAYQENQDVLSTVAKFEHLGIGFAKDKGLAEPLSTPANESIPYITEIAEKDAKLSSDLAERIVPTPVVVFEKADSGPHYEDGLVTNANHALKRGEQSVDARPSDMVVRGDSGTPELADTAAEVADWAALLDRDQPTPPISDEEAGRIGFRRMSATPIPDVARVAAEVADVAAKLDDGEDDSDDSIPIITKALAVSGPKIEDDVSLGLNTPEEERVPLFSHECATFPDHTEPCTHEIENSLESLLSRYEDPSEQIDLNDPSIEMFPTDRSAIMEKLREIQDRLPEDETRIDGVPLSPVVSPDSRSSPQLPHTSGFHGKERSSSLQSISEENVDKIEIFTLNDINEVDDHPTEISEERKTEQKSVGNGKSVSTEIEVPGHSEQHGRDSEMGPADQHTNIITEPGSQSVPVHKDPIMIDSNDESAMTRVGETPRKTEVQVTRAESYKQKQLNLDVHCDSLGNLVAPAVMTPFIVGDHQFGSNEPDKVPTGLGAQNIRVEASNPEESYNDPSNLQPVDTASTSDFSDAVSTEPSLRKSIGRGNINSPQGERSVTPNSLRSAGKQASDRNFLRAFWRVVFVEWIGGFIMRLCGGRRRTVMIAGVMAILAIAPAAFYSGR